MKKILGVILGLLVAGVAFAIAAVLGGSLIWIAGGAKALDVKGEAKPVQEAPAAEGWAHYGGDPGGARYSSAGQITPENVRTLTVAWR